MPTVTIIKPIIENENGVKLRVAAYCRVSSDSADQLNSYMAQMTYYSGKFENSETEILVDLYADEGISGTRDDKRAEFQRMISDCRKGKIDRIYTKSISRFARNTKDCLKNIRELKALGISIFFEKENLDTAKITDEIMITVLGGLAQEESVSISQNMKWSYHKQMTDGTISQHSAPYGYTIVNGKLEITPEQAEIIKMIFEMFLSGKGYYAICNELNQKGIFKSENGDKWTISAVEYILKNERYIGDSLWQKNYNEGIPFRKIRNHGMLPQYYISNTHFPIIEREIFEKVQHIIESRTFRAKEIVPYPLSKKIICGICNSTYKRIKKNSKIYWICRKHNMSASECPHKAIEEQKIYDIFIRMFNKILTNYKEIIVPVQTALQELKVRRFSNNKNVMEIHREQIKLKEQLHVIAGLRTKGFITDAKYQEQNTEINRKIRKLQKDLKMLTTSDDDETLEQIEMLVDFFEKREKIMAEFEEKSFSFLVDKIVVHHKKMEFQIVGGLKFTEKIT